MIANGISSGKCLSRYRFSVLHFEPQMLRFTGGMVFFTDDATVKIRPSVPPELVLLRRRAVIHISHPLSIELALQLSLPSPPVRQLPKERVMERAFEQLRAGGKRGARPAGTSGVTPVRKSSASRTGVSGTGSAQKVLLRAADDARENMMHAEEAVYTISDEARRAAVELSILTAELARADVHCARLYEELGEGKTTLDELRARYEHALKQVAAKEHVEAELRKAREDASGFTPWRMAQLDSKDKVGKPLGLAAIIHQLTGFRSARAFRAFYYHVLERLNCRRAGITNHLDYYYGPKHNPSKSPLASDPSTGQRMSGQLSEQTPGGLDSPMEACFLTFCILRLGLGVDVAAALFRISPGSVSQIFNTWVPFISTTLTNYVEWPSREQVRATLPKRFKDRSSVLGRTTHASRCRIIIDCTEIEIQEPSDPAVAKKH